MSKNKPKVPSNILLGTDFSARSDRAYDRAIALAREWAAHLTIVHSIEFEPYHKNVPSWRQGPGRVEATRKKVKTVLDREALSPAPAIVIERGKPENVILDAARAHNTDLIVTGVAHSEPLGRNDLGNTVGTIARKAACPVLVVKTRPYNPYRHVVIAIDRSETSKKVMDYVSAVFPDTQISILHAVHVPFKGQLGNIAEMSKTLCAEARDKCQIFIREAMGAEFAGKIKLVVDENQPETMLQEYITDLDADLVVIGAHGETGFFDALIGNTAKAILETVTCDVLLVR